MPIDGQYDEQGRLMCGAKTRSGHPCKSPAVRGAKRCRMHGGKTPAGQASPHFKHGRYSKVLPERLFERYQASLRDPEILNLRDEIALTEARLSDLIGRAHTGEAGELWRRLQEERRLLLWAKQKDDQTAMANALNNIVVLIGEGATEFQAWQEIHHAIEARRRLVESERKRLVEMQATLAADRAMVLLVAVVDIVKKHVTDRRVLAAVAHDIRMLVQGRRDAEAQPARMLAQPVEVEEADL